MQKGDGFFAKPFVQHPGTGFGDRVEQILKKARSRAEKYHNREDSNVAVPRNEKNPATSVTVVKMMEEAVAGS